jgi:hypothetical protein
MPYPPALITPRRSRMPGQPLGQPFPLATLNRWYAADTESYANNDAVATWHDRSPNAYDATQGTAGYKPVFKTNILNGLPMILFDGSDDRLTAVTTNLSGTAATIFGVTYNPTAMAVGDNDTWISYMSTTGAEQLRMDAVNLAAGNDILWAIAYDAAAYQASLLAPLGLAAVIDRAKVVALSIANGVDSRMFLNGAHLFTGPAPAWNMSAINNFTIGGVGYGANYAQFWAGYLGEILVYTTQLTNMEIGAVLNYLMNKWLPGNKVQ